MYYSNGELISTPESEYKTELLQKRLLYNVANFAQIRFKRAMQMRMTLPNENK